MTTGVWTESRELRRYLVDIASFLHSSEAKSLLAIPLSTWEVLLRQFMIIDEGRAESAFNNTRGAFRRMHQVMVEGSYVDPWIEDRWNVRSLGITTSHPNLINWSRVRVPWLRIALKRHARTALTTKSRSWQTVGDWCDAAARFSKFLLSDVGVDVEPSAVSRGLFLDYLGTLTTDSATARARLMAQLLVDLGERGLVDGLPQTSFLLRGEAVVRKTRRPKPYPADITERIDNEILNSPQLEHTEQLIMKLLRASGPRPAEALTLPVDCLRINPGGNYWIEYWMPKVSEWRRFPIPENLGDELRAQQDWVRAVYGPGAEHMFPATRRSLPRSDDRTGRTIPWSYSGFNKMVIRVFSFHGITESSMTGERITGGELHRYRHTIATEMLNNDWSLYEVQKFLGHVSSTMTQAYAEIHDDTLDSKYREMLATACDKDGNLMRGIDVGVERLRERMAKAVLPNGYCDLPETKSCDFRPNPCLSCSFYRTTPLDLPTHRRHRSELKLVVEQAEDSGNQRILEINRPMLDQVERIIDVLEVEVEPQ